MVKLIFPLNGTLDVIYSFLCLFLYFRMIRKGVQIMNGKEPFSMPSDCKMSDKIRDLSLHGGNF